MAYSLVKTILAFALLAVVACTPLTNSTNTTNMTLPDVPDKHVDTPKTPTPVENMDDFSSHLTFTEGDLIKLKTLATDPDNDVVTLEFSEPFDEDGVWQTQAGDAGDYPVTVTAADSRGATVSTRILVSVKYANRAPTIDCPGSVSVDEGETVELDCTASDPDGDETILSFSGWMQGDTYKTTHADQGKHTVTVTAEDGTLTTKKDISVTVGDVNQPPIIKLPQADFSATELVPFTMKASASDPDGDKVTITYGEPLNSDGTWTPQLDQDGEYDVQISASDGTDTTVQSVKLTVARTNRPPTVAIPGGEEALYVKEGSFIDLRKLLDISDPEGAEVIADYSGWMSGPTRQVSYDDAGTHVVTITANDNTTKPTKADITIVVEDVNRPPVFVRPA